MLIHTYSAMVSWMETGVSTLFLFVFFKIESLSLRIKKTTFTDRQMEFQRTCVKCELKESHSLNRDVD